MNKDLLWEAMEHVDLSLVEAADVPVPRRRRRVRALLIAAAVCLSLSAIVWAAAGHGFHVLRFSGGEDIFSSYSISSDTLSSFPAEQFGPEAQALIANGMEVLSRRPAGHAAEGLDLSVFTLNVPQFDTWGEAAAFVGEEIPLAGESSALSGCAHTKFSVHVSQGSRVTVGGCYTLDGHQVLVHAEIAVEGGSPFGSGTAYDSDTSLAGESGRTGSGAEVLLYIASGAPVEDHNFCDAYFVRDGILYNLFISGVSDSALMREILDTF